MSKPLTSGHARFAIKICAVTAVAALMSGCSADTGRFGDAFGNPFSTGSVPKPKKVVHKPAPAGAGRTPPVTASALPPADRAAARSAAPAVSHETTGSIPSSTPVKGASFGGWTGQGGASVQVGAGDTAAVLAQRYGVPENVLLQTNNLHSAAEVRPGTTIVIPIYNAVASAPGASRVAAAPVRSEPVEPEERAAPAREERAAPVKTVPAHVAKAEPKPEPEEAPAPARKAAPVPFKVERPTTLAERNAEAQRIVATQRAADKAAADKLAVAQKAAEAQKQAEARKAAAAEKVAAAEKAKADAAAARKLAAKSAPKADPKAAAAAKAEAAKVAAAEKAAATQKLAADREAAKAKAAAVKTAADAAKTAAAAAKAAKVAAAAPAKPEQVAAVEKKVDATPTASVQPAAAPAAAPAAVADAGGPEFRWPARGRIIGGFKTGGNDGINIAVPEGTAVKAAEGGTVAYAGNELKGYGNMVLIKHPNGYVTAYANNGEISVKKGDKVARGQMIAKSGQSGDVSSPQLHFEVRKGSTPVDPTGLLAGT